MWLIYQGPPNYWLDTTSSELKMATVQGTPSANPTYRNSADQTGPVYWRDASVYALGKLATTTNVLKGSMGGAYFIWEQAGVVSDFEEFSVDIAPYDGGVGGANGVVFNYNIANVGKTFYAVMMRNSTIETGIGLYKVVCTTSCVVTALGSVVTSVSYQNNVGTWTTMNANGPRIWTRLIVTKSAGRITVYVNNGLGTPVIDYVDASPLAPGNVGLHTIGTPAIVWDNVVFNDAPSCSDGIFNGDEDGIDCGGSCSSACVYPFDFNWDFTAQGLKGWKHETYGNDPNGNYNGQAFVFTPATEGLTMPTNANGALPGSTGTNAQSWTGSWWLTSTQQPPVMDVDFTVEIYPKDNDYIGLTWRFVDRDNFYVLNMRNEGGSGTPKVAISRRRAGVNTPIWGSAAADLPASVTGNPTCPDASWAYSRVPYHQCVRQKWRIRHIGSRIELYLPDFTTSTSLTATALAPILFGVAIDPDPLYVAGQTGVISTSHDGTIVYTMTARHFATSIAMSATQSNLPISTASKAALSMGIDARVTDPAMSEALIPDYSLNGRGLYGSPYMAGTTTIPSVVPYRRCGNVAYFSPGTFLYSHARNDVEPGIAGMTYLMAFSLPTVPTGSTKYNLASKGARLPTMNGWKLVVEDRGAGARLYLSMRTNVARVNTDNTMEVSTPIGINTAYVLAFTVYPDPAQGAQSRLENTRFLVKAWLNNATFTSMADNTYTGIVSTGESLTNEFYVGSAEDMSNGADMMLFEIQAYNIPLVDREVFALYSALATKWQAGASSATVLCPDLTLLPNVTYDNFQFCSNATDGAVCTLSCPAGTMSTGGTSRLECQAGDWSNTPLSCVAACPVPADTTARNMDQKQCTADLWREDFTAVTVPNFPTEVGACPFQAPFQSWDSVPQGVGAWVVNTPGQLKLNRVPGVTTSRVTFGSGYYSFEPSLTATNSRIIVRGIIPPMPTDGSVSKIIFYPRYIDAKNYYAYIVTATTGALTAGQTTVTNSTVFVRVKAGTSTTLCTGTAAINAAIGYPRNQIDVQFDQAGALRVITNGITWCPLASENAIPIGDPGYGVEGASDLNFGPLAVMKQFDTCTDGSMRSIVPVGATITSSCNVGYTTSGNLTRQCLASGQLSGTPLVCVLAPPTMSDQSVSVPSLAAAGTFVASFVASNIARGQAVTYSILSGNSNNTFTIGGCDGVVRVAYPRGLDYKRMFGDAFFTLAINAQVVGSSVNTTAYLQVTATPVNYPPYVVQSSCAVNENSLVGSTVCSLQVVDPDTSTPNYNMQLLFQEVPNVFSLSGNILQVQTAALNFEAKSTYSVTVRTVDATDATSFTDNQLTILVNDVNEAPIVTGPTFISVLSTDMLIGRVLPSVVITYVDPDAGDYASSYGLATTGSYTALLAISNSTLGTVKVNVNTASTYTLASIFSIDSFLVVDYAMMQASVTDSRGLTGTLMVPVYILPNISSSSYIVRSMVVLPSNAATGSGTTTGSSGTTHLIATDGSDAVRFGLDNLVAAPNMVVMGFVNGTGGSWIVTCDFEGLGSNGYVGSDPIALTIRCPTKPGYGTTWNWKLVYYDTVTTASTPIITTVATVTSYAPPIITSITVQGSLSTSTVPTVGGQAVLVAGYNFGGPTAPVTVQYGPLVGSTVNYMYALTIVPSDIQHTQIRGLVAAGAGANLQVRANVGGVIVTVASSIVITYNPPVVFNVTAAGNKAPVNMSTAGGDIIYIQGSDFGPVGTAPVLYLGPSVGPVPNPTPSMFPIASISQSTGLSTCTVTSAHTQITCTMVPGAGSKLTGVVSIVGGVSNLVPTQISYQAPVINGITGAGSRDMDTKGGQTFVLSGSGFGPAKYQGAGLVFAAPVVRYGPAADPTRFTATNCVPIGTGVTSLSCFTSQGSGAGPLIFQATVANQTSEGWTAPAYTKYSNPKINSFVVVTGFPNAITGAQTTGGESVIITGKSFGGYNVSSPVALTAGQLGYEVYYYTTAILDGNETSIKYRSPFCYKPLWDDTIGTQHERMQCVIAPGAGTSLKWQVVVDGQISDEPTTSYAAPVITAVSSAATGLPQRISNAVVGTVVYLQGNYLGPLSSTLVGKIINKDSNYLQWVKFGPGGGHGPAAYSPLDAKLITDHAVIQVTLPPGIGTDLQFQVSVADQVSDASPIGAGSFDYATPVITSITPATAPTSGGQIVKVFATGLGLLDPTTLQSVTFAGMPVQIVDRFPAAQRVQTAADAGNYSLLTAAEIDENQHYVSFILPAWTGLNLPVTVIAYRRDEPSSRVVNTPANEQPATWFSYPLPYLALVQVEAVTNPAIIAQAQALFGFSVDLAGVRQVTLFGQSFGPLAAPTEIQVADETDPATFDSRVAVLSWTDTSVTALTTVPRGHIRMGVQYTLPTDADTAPSSAAYSNTLQFTDIAPSVQGITGGPASGVFNTAGGESVVIQAGNVYSFATLQIFIGGTAVDILTNDGASVVPSNQVRAVIIDDQFNAQSLQGISPQNMQFNVRVRVPPGQGSAVSIALLRDGVNGTGPVYIRYAAPTITSIAITGNAAIPVGQVNMFSPFRIPTIGATITLVGANFGTCPVVKFGVSRGAYCSGDQQAGDEISILSNPSHTQLIITLPPGIGRGSWYLPPGIFLEPDAADQKATPVRMAYALPTVTGFTPAYRGSGLPTAGGVLVNITGTNFGPLTAGLPVVQIMFDDSASQPCSNVVRNPSSPHTSLTCTLPEGSGKNVHVRVTVGDQSGTEDMAFSYDRALIYNISVVANTTTGYGSSFNHTGSSTGGYVVIINGTNFGPYDPSAQCVFLPHSALTEDAMICNGMADSWDEQEVPAANIISWSHTSVVMVMPAGTGRRVVRVVPRGQMSAPLKVKGDVWTYTAPVITSISYTVGGGIDPTVQPVRVTIRGRGFGIGPTIDSNAAHRASGWSSISMPTSRDIIHEAGLPQSFALRVNFFSAQSCISSAYADTTTSTVVYQPNIMAFGDYFHVLPDGVMANECKSDNPLQPNENAEPRGIVTHTDDTIVFWSSPGIGKGRLLNISIVGVDGSVVDSNVVSFSFTPPNIEAAVPSIVYMEPPLVTGVGRYSEASTTALDFAGKYFGRTDMQTTWSASEKLVKIMLDDMECISKQDTAATPHAIRVDRTDPSTTLKVTDLQCDLGYTTAASRALAQLIKVGPKPVTVTVAGQESQDRLPNDPILFHTVCDRGYYGLPGEVCLACPTGATCDGYKSSLAEAVGGYNVAANKVKYGRVGAWPDIRAFTSASNHTFADYCFHCHTAPRANPGYFNMRGYTKDDGTSDTTCEPIRKAEGLRTGVDCENILSCDPPEACLSDNVCAEGYASNKWPYRCSQCADGFYRSNQLCKRCPDSPELTIVFFFLVALAAIAMGWFLNQKQVNIAFLTIGLDYMQVLAIFANTRVPWPDQIKELFRILSAFNLNIEIVAPECAFKGITYSQKWLMIMALPLVVFGLLLCMHCVNIAFATFVRGQSKHLIPSMASPLIAMSQVLMYFLYLYITRSVFDVMTCRSSDPPEYDAAGTEKMFMAGLPGEQCGLAGGTQSFLLGFAIAALIVYVIGYPSLVGWNLWKNRELVMEDQLLRAKKTGDDKLTNPNALEFRRRFSRTYYQFKPDCFLWVLAIICRKFLIAISSLVFNQNQNFQLAAMLLVLAIAYAAQVRFLPYMGPGNFDLVLKQHSQLALQGNPLQARLANRIAQVQARGRKKTFVNTFGGARDMSLSGLASALGRFLFDYNSVEAILIASALLVSLSGCMFGSLPTNVTQTVFMTQSRDGVMSGVIILVAFSIIYWLTVVFVEVYVMISEEGIARKMRARQASGKGGKEGSDGKGSSGRRSLRASDEDAAVILSAPVESQMNPMLIGANGKANSAMSTGISVDVIKQLVRVPESQLWIAVRQAYVSQAEKAAELSSEISRLKAELAKVEMDAEDTSGRPTDDHAPSTTAARKKAFSPTAAHDGRDDHASGRSTSSFRGNAMSLGARSPGGGNLASLRQKR